MPDMAEIMTLRDLADYLRMNERTISKLVADGKIPGFKVASQWRFSRESIDAWFKAQMQNLGVATDGQVAVKVGAILAPEVMKLDLTARTKDGVLAEMTDLMARAGRVADSEVLLAALRERERLCSTGIGRGVAFLHPRHAIAEIVKEPVLALGRSAEGVEFDAVDGRKVHLFFLDCSPSERVHLAVLARLSRLLSDDYLLEKLRRYEDSAAIVSEIKAAEAAFAGRE